MPAMKRKPTPKPLERIARAIHDKDEFVAHIGGIAERYRREHALDAGPRGREVRQALRVFRKHATALGEWLEQASSRPKSLEFDALERMGAALRGLPNRSATPSQDVLAWLTEWDDAARLAEERIQPKAAPSAPRVAAEALRATFERHGLKWSTRISQAPVALLCAIARQSGDDSLTPQAAREQLVAIGARSPAIATPVRR